MNILPYTYTHTPRPEHVQIPPTPEPAPRTTRLRRVTSSPVVCGPPRVVHVAAAEGRSEKRVEIVEEQVLLQVPLPCCVCVQLFFGPTVHS
jgi:hypothetical protein